jgi:pyruvate,water dikinase
MVPPDHHREFDDLLVEARLTYRIRDERTYFNDTWSTGIARRAVLEAGRRLAADGRLHAADDAVELVPAELYAALRGDGAAIADIAAERTAFRLGHTTDDAPEWVGGPEPGDPPPAEWLPPDAARGQRAIGLVINSIFESTPAAGSARVISGTGASSGAVTGSARVVLAPAEMGRLRQGDVLVAPYTSPAFNGVLPLVSAIVTDRGGSLSHAAIVAREFGIPAVVGCGDATRRVKDGQTIDVDGQAGTVSLR